METKAKWNVSTKIEKFNTHEDYLNGIVSEIKRIDGNLLLDGGVTDLWNLVIGADNEGAGVEHFDNTHSYIGVGTSNFAPDSAQTGLQAGTGAVWYKPMDATYPIVTANKVTFKSTFTGSGSGGDEEAAFAWEEWSVARGVAGAYVYATFVADDLAWISTNIHKNLNRKVEPMGTKASAATWVITVEISLT